MHRGHFGHRAQLHPDHALWTGQDVLRHGHADPQGHLRQGQRGAGPPEKVRSRN